MRKACCLVLPSLACVFLLCCGGEQHSPVSAGWSDELADPTGQPLRKTEVFDTLSKEGPTPVTGAQSTPAVEHRVRHDVMIAKDAPHQPSCSCLAVVVASAADPRLAWQNEAPKLEQDVAIAAVSAKGVVCQGLPEDAPRRPSISAVAREGADVVVTIEDLPPGRPLASGAVFLKPGPGGAVYVKPKDPKVPYGRPLAGAGGRCKVR
jgi:hypothetical protein